MTRGSEKDKAPDIEPLPSPIPFDNDVIAIGLLAIAEEISMLRDNQDRAKHDLSSAYGEGTISSMTTRLREILIQKGVI